MSDHEQQPASSQKKKGRPTPSRKQSEARNARPLIPADRKEARRQARAIRDAQYRREQQAMETGDERFLPEREKGRVRRFIRDWIDARWSFSEFLLPVMVLFFAIMMALALIKSLQDRYGAQIMLTATIVMYSLLFIAIVEGSYVWWRLKRKIAEHYPNDTIPRGAWYYCFSRMIMARRWRRPRPMVARGQFPDRKKK